MPPNPDQAPTAPARSDSWKLAWMIARLPGLTSAPPMPSRTRATTSITMPWETPQSSDAPANQTVPITRILLRPKRSPSAPPSRTSDDNASK